MYYMHGERGRAGLTRNRAEFCKLLWRLWSPTWLFDDQTYERSAPAFYNPDFVDDVIHSYRVRYGLVQGDPALAGHVRHFSGTYQRLENIISSWLTIEHTAVRRKIAEPTSLAERG